MCFKVFSKSPIGFNGFQNMFQRVFKISNRFQWFSHHEFQSVFKFPHMFQWFSNDVFQSVFKMSCHVIMWIHLIMWLLSYFYVELRWILDFSLHFESQADNFLFFFISVDETLNIVTSILRMFNINLGFHKSNYFNKSPIGFNGFHIMCFKVFSKSPLGSNGFPNNAFQIVFKISTRFQWFSKWCVSNCFQNVS